MTPFQLENYMGTDQKKFKIQSNNSLQTPILTINFPETQQQ